MPSNTPYTSFPVLQAARIKGPAALQAYLDEEPSNLYARDPYTNISLLIYASGFSQLGCVDLLLERGADIHEESSLGMQAIHAAAGARFAGSAEMIHRLVRAGADINAQDLEGRTPMHYASYYALKENVEALWQYRPDLALLDRYNRTATVALRERPRGIWTRDYDTVQAFLQAKEIEQLQEVNAAQGIFLSSDVLAAQRGFLARPASSSTAPTFNLLLLALFVLLVLRNLFGVGSSSTTTATTTTKVVEVADAKPLTRRSSRKAESAQ